MYSVLFKNLNFSSVPRVVDTVCDSDSITICFFIFYF